MQIKTRLTLLFVAIVALINLIASSAIFLASDNYRKDIFNSRLSSKASNTAKLLIEVEEIDFNLLKRIEKNNPVSLPEEKIIIFNQENEIIYSTDDANFIKHSTNILNQIREKKEIEYFQENHEIIGFLFNEGSNQFIVLAGAVDIYGIKKMENLRGILFIVFFISLIAVFIAGRIFAGRALKPISKVIDQVNKISISSLNLRVDSNNGKDEIANLIKTFNNMLNRLENAFKIQKNFIANASHELRTPLTIITGQLEVILMNNRTNDEYKLTLASVLEDIKNLNYTSNRLLLLAQASSEHLKEGFLKIRVDDILWSASQELKKRNPNYNINIQFVGEILDDSHLTIYGNEQLIKTAILNLIDNGCKYSKNQSALVKMSFNHPNLTLSFEDKGIGISPEDQKLIFQPFHRGKNSLTIKGHGIGLSLAERIVKMHNGSINVLSELNVGTTVNVVLPIQNTT